MTDKVYQIDTDTVVDGTVTAKKFIGMADVQAEEAIVAQKDQLGQTIDNTYIKSISTENGLSIDTVKGDDTAGPSIALRTYAAGTGLSSDIFGTVDTLSVDYGNTANTACEGNDARLSDARTPLPHDQSSDTITTLTGYVISQSVSPLTTADSLNDALGKLEKSLSEKQTTLSATTPISLDNNTLTHDISGVTAGTYTKMTVDAKGHVTAGSQATITDLGLTNDDLLNVEQQQVPTSNTNAYHLIMASETGVGRVAGPVTKSAATSRWVNGKGTVISSDILEGNIESDNIASKTVNRPVQFTSPVAIGSENNSINVTHYGQTTTIGNVSIDGDLGVSGDLTVDGSLHIAEGIIEHYEVLYIGDAYIILRENATYGLNTGQYSGFQVKLYNGTDDGRLVIDNTGTARVGDVGDEQPLMTRDEVADMTSGAMLKWDSTHVKAVTASSADVFAAAGFTFTTVSTDE